MKFLSEHYIFMFLVQFTVLLGFSKLLGLLFQRWKQPTVTADILIGLILGPTILGRLCPSFHGWLFPADTILQTMLDTVAWIGILFLLMETGLEVNFSRIWRQKGQAVKLSTADIIIPIIVSGFLIYWLPDRFLPVPEQRLVFTIFMATIMTISALPVAIRGMQDVNILKTDLGFLIISALSINDIIGWLIFAILLGIFSHQNASVGYYLGILIATVAYTAFSLTLLRKAADYLIRGIKIHYAENMALAISLLAVMGMISGAITIQIGIHALFGFFIMGLVAGESAALSEKDRATISRMVYAIFVPIFFASIGLKVDFIDSFNPFLAIFITVAGIVGRYCGAYIGSIWARAPKANRSTIAIAHTPGGQMEIVVGILALEAGLISQTIFVAIIFGAIVSSIALGPWLNIAIKRRKISSLLPYIQPGHVIFLQAETKHNAICELTDRIAGKAGIPAERICQLTLQREDGMSSAVEFGIAFPHARVPGLAAPLIAIGISKKGIEWDSPDGLPSRLIFLLVTPESQEDAQLQFLRLLSTMLYSGDIRERLLAADDSSQVSQILGEFFSSRLVPPK